MVLVGAAERLHALLEIVDHVLLPASSRKVGSQSWCWTISFEICPGLILPG